MTTFPPDAPTAPAGMMQYVINNQSICPNVSVTIKFNETKGIGLIYKLTVSSSAGCALQECPMVLSPKERTLNITLSVGVNYTVTLVVSNDCGSDSTTVLIQPQGNLRVVFTQLFPSITSEDVLWQCCPYTAYLHSSLYVSIPSNLPFFY